MRAEKKIHLQFTLTLVSFYNFLGLGVYPLGKPHSVCQWKTPLVCKNHMIWTKGSCYRLQNLFHKVKKWSCGQFRSTGFLDLTQSRFDPEKQDSHNTYFNTWQIIKGLLEIITF